MPPKRGRLPKKETTVSPVADGKVSPKTNSKTDTGLETNYKVTVNPPAWILPNRVSFGPWIDTTFKYRKVRYPVCSECEEGESCQPKIAVSSVSLFPHQDFIKDYMQFASPYRGLLVYHGLGSGKTASSIIAAEILMNHMSVTVMLPASLRDNYINEVKKYGSTFFNTKQHWTFVNKEGAVKQAVEKLKISPEILKKNKGVWIPDSTLAPNFNTLGETARVQIETQIHNIIENRYNFINYNGLQRKSIEKMVADGKNPFDGKTIIIDEIHNLISRIVNGRKIGSALYKLLMTAKNCKLILLSGTPIINYPYEIAYILNLITGPLKFYELKASKASEFKRDAIETVLLENEFVDDFVIDISGRKLVLFLLPQGFHYVNRKLTRVARYTGAIKSHEDIISEIVQELKKKIGHDFNKRTTAKDTTLFPEKKEDFDMLFVNEEEGTIRNPRLFMKRALGTVSYYNTFSPELFPSWKIEEVPVPMNTSQFNLYEKSRADERKKESLRTFKKQAAEGLFSNSGQVYRFFSRAVCNFVFPETIKRPFPSKLSDMKKEIDDDEDIINVMDKMDEEDTKSKKQEEYAKRLEECLSAIRSKKEDYLSLSEVSKYSPKFEKIITNIMSSPGGVLVYSQFRKVEGLGLLGIALEANGWSEFKIKKAGTDWVIDMTDEELSKPSYAAFTGNNEESRILLKIFNNELESIPEGIKKVLGEGSNLRGDIIKAFMITQSGAEGISLKNVRQVHIVEPYWNHIRMDQVIGRAVRTCSHVALPPSERNVQIYIYYSVFTKEQKDASFTLRTLDKSATSDEYLFQIAKKKKAITDGLLEMLQKASVDCVLNAKYHGLRCFSFPVNMNDDKFTLQHDILLEEQDGSYKNALEKNTWSGQLLKTKKGNFVIKEGTNDVYDYDAYMQSGKVIKVGTLAQNGTTRVIKFVD